MVPIGAYFVTKRICLGLQRKDANMLAHGVEIGIIRQLPSGEFIEEERPLTEEERAVIDSKHVYKSLPAPEEADVNGVPAPAARGPLGRARAIANRAFTETVAVPEGARQRSRQRARRGRGRRARRDRLPRGAVASSA